MGKLSDLRRIEMSAIILADNVKENTTPIGLNTSINRVLKGVTDISLPITTTFSLPEIYYKMYYIYKPL